MQQDKTARLQNPSPLKTALLPPHHLAIKLPDNTRLELEKHQSTQKATIKIQIMSVRWR